MNESDAPTPRQPSRREDAVEIVRRLRDAGHVAYLAGGCVRDELLGLQPKDFDVATDATPDRVRTLFPKSQAIGAAFGVILVRLGRSMIEVATFRTDSTYSDGRRPDAVTFTNAEQDARRRDFTINGLFLDPIDNRVIDFVGGKKDLRARRLRAIGDPQSRFGEDYLRLIRAVRFAARFDLKIESATREAILKFAPRLAQISPERICDELRLILAPPTRVAAWRMLGEFGFVAVIFRFLQQPHYWPPYSDRYFDPVFPLVSPSAMVSFPLALAAAAIDVVSASVIDKPLHRLFDDAGASAVTSALRKSLRFSNEEGDDLWTLLRSKALLDPDRPPSIARMKRFLASPIAPDARQLLDAIAAGYSSERPRIGWLKEQFAQLDKGDVAPPPLITGDDLIAAGLTPGPAFKRILELAYDEQLEGRLIARDQALKFAMETDKSQPRSEDG